MGIGRGLVRADVSVDFRPEMPSRVREYAYDSFPEFRAGLNWRFDRRWMIGIEYRCFEADLSFKRKKHHGKSNGARIDSELKRAEVDINTEQITAGVTFRF